jgi:hypothetical protein
MNLDWLSWSNPVAIWWCSLTIVSALNIVLWCKLQAHSSKTAIRASTGLLAIEPLMLLAGAYVFGCAFRSILPRADVQRICLFDTWLSSVMVGRSVATVAELCFAAQWALVLHRSAWLGGSPFVMAASLAVVPLIALAEGCSWYAVLTTEQRAHAAENSLWGLAAALIVAGMLVIGPHGPAALYRPMIAGGSAYVAFIFVYDVPMYWSRWRADQANGRRYLSVAEGLVDVGRRWMVSCRWEDWRSEVAWMSLYFTFGVWSSIWLVYASLAFAHGS